MDSIRVSTEPDAIAVIPDGWTTYVANYRSDNVSVIDTQTNRVVGSISVGKGPSSIGITSDDKTAYVVNLVSNTISVIDTQTNQVVGRPIRVGKWPFAIAVH